MRAALAAFTLLATPATAWDFTETSICTVTHAGPDMALTLTFDPAQSLYAITLARPNATWPLSNTFQLRFDGPRPLIIGTDRHVVSDAGRNLSVSDTGFGNVLDGLQFNEEMVAIAGNESVSLSTQGAEAALQAFRACPTTPTS